LFGLAVYVVCGLYVWLAFFVANRIGRRGNVAKVLTLVIFVLIPTWDILPGKLYHEHLCKTEGGIQVFKTVEVDNSYFLPNGQPEEKKLFELLDWQTAVDRSHSNVFHIQKYQGTLSEKQTGNRLGIATDFWYKGGWLTRLVLPDGSSTICPQYPNYTVSSSLWREAIHPRPGT
jgi:hypothetical protein